MATIRTNHELRLKAFDLLQVLKGTNISRKEAIETIHSKYGIPPGTLYDWHRNKFVPYGRRGVITYKPEIFYILGALLGDGCMYQWKITQHYLILVGDRRFAKKYAGMLTKCTERKAKAYINRSNAVWFVRCNNFELYSIFKKIRHDLDYLEWLIEQRGGNAAMLFVEGFFDAEGCVKVIKGKERKTAKICLDMTNTNFALLELVRRLLLEQLDIRARYSVQKDPRKNRKLVYHLRIYKKEYVGRFLNNVRTTKLRPHHLGFVESWLGYQPERAFV